MNTVTETCNWSEMQREQRTVKWTAVTGTFTVQLLRPRIRGWGREIASVRRLGCLPQESSIYDKEAKAMKYQQLGYISKIYIMISCVFFSVCN